MSENKEDKKLFKDEPKQYKPKKKTPSRLFLVLTYMYIKFNRFMLWLAILINALFIVVMLLDFNSGIFLFILNQYLIIRFYAKVRKEERERKHKEIQRI